MSGAAVDPALERAILAARDRREQRGATGDGRVAVGELTAEEALALDGLLASSRRRPVLPGTTLRVALSTFEAALRAAGIDPHRAYVDVGGRALRDLPAERAAERARRGEFRSWLRSHPAVVGRPMLAEWCDQAARQGRVHDGIRPLVERGLRVLAALPAQPPAEWMAPAAPPAQPPAEWMALAARPARPPVQRTVLAATLLDGDPHALDTGTPLHGLVVALLAAAASLGPEVPARSVWAAWGVLVDPVSSSVAGLNLPLGGEGPAATIARAVSGTHVVLTHGQLAASELSWPANVGCFSCENPSVLIAAEQRLGPRCPPLICTAGRPSDAVRLLLSLVQSAGGRVRHHGDYDEAGIQILRDLQASCGAVAWRFDVQSLREALGARAPGPERLPLEETVRRLSCPLPEELLIEELLDDLRQARVDT